MHSTDFIKSHLATIAWRDGAAGGFDCMRACAFAIRNRARLGWHGGDWVQILSHHRDYAAVNMPPQFDLPDPNQSGFRLLLQTIDGIFSGTADDDVTRPDQALMGPIVSFGQPDKPVALYYGDLSSPNIREWFLESISRQTDKHSLIATVGPLSFFS